MRLKQDCNLVFANLDNNYYNAYCNDKLVANVVYHNGTKEWTVKYVCGTQVHGFKTMKGVRHAIQNQIDLYKEQNRD